MVEPEEVEREMTGYSHVLSPEQRLDVLLSEHLDEP
jgi:hypothetical protein